MDVNHAVVAYVKLSNNVVVLYVDAVNRQGSWFLNVFQGLCPSVHLLVFSLFFVLELLELLMQWWPKELVIQILLYTWWYKDLTWFYYSCLFVTCSINLVSQLIQEIQIKEKDVILNQKMYKKTVFSRKLVIYYCMIF